MTDKTINRFPCPTCSGSGEENGYSPIVHVHCPSCNEGYVSVGVKCNQCVDGGIIEKRHGILADYKCNTCKGKGYRPLTDDELEEIAVKLASVADLVYLPKQQNLERVINHLAIGASFTFKGQPVKLIPYKGV
jgi:hypothetical protein